ncbi:hypothetical protein APR11_005655 [Nocardia amikacinitolerans]|uniref:hypothetical protein n=1 Tax=Nocardia amikacinitolerans TaxID=756689 RepID=UPI0020A330B0|nr:hypothetical protein [Nocardia amikacinitolerans]MCP2299205.1 hypothetical protein [Nocardia amikacinitolerans]
MTEPLTLAGVGALALAQGITFLYGQVDEILRRRRERRSAENDAETTMLPGGGGDVLDGELRSAPVDFDLVEGRIGEFERLYEQLSRYAQQLADVDPADPELLERVEALRRLLELVYGQRITFRGERRDTSGTTIEVVVEAERVDGYLAGVRARAIDGADIDVRTKAGDVGAGGRVVGVDADRIGG